MLKTNNSKVIRTKLHICPKILNTYSQQIFFFTSLKYQKDIYKYFRKKDFLI